MSPKTIAQIFYDLIGISLPFADCIRNIFFKTKIAAKVTAIFVTILQAQIT